MFLNSRRKIVRSIMIVLALFLVTTLTGVYVASYVSTRAQNEDMLDRYVSMYSLESLPGEDGQSAPSEPEGGIPEIGSSGVYQLSFFYSAAVSEDGSVLAVDTGESGLYREEDIVELAEQILKSGRESGTLEGLMYRMEVRDTYTLVALIDTTVTDSQMNTLLLYTLVAGGLCMILFFGISLWLARWIIRPLEENDRKQKQFVSDVEHELKTPIAVIGANADILERESGANPWLANIRFENERLGNLAKELLELSRLEQGKPAAEEVDLSWLVEKEVLPFESLAFEKGMTITCECPAGIRISGSRTHLERLVSILLDNAISHGAAGEISVKLSQERHHTCLEVSNPGPMIPEEDRDRLFDRFYRMDASREEGHFGLGLSMAKAIAEAHGGIIRMECPEGRVRFIVSLPGI